jgi:hypothetical protein
VVILSEIVWDAVRSLGSVRFRFGVEVGGIGRYLLGFERDFSTSRPLKLTADYGSYSHYIHKICMHCWGSKEPRAVIADLLLLLHAIFDLGETTRIVSYMKVSHLSPSGLPCWSGSAMPPSDHGPPSPGITACRWPSSG